MEQITPTEIRQFMLDLEDTGHTPRGIHACYRTLRAWLRWYENEDAPIGWRNPILRVKPPRLPAEVLAPIPIEDIQKLLETCDRKTFSGMRDACAFLTLTDTGCRAQELLDINIEDCDTTTGAIIIRCGKGGKGRTVFLGNTSRRAMKAYLKVHPIGTGALFVRQSDSGRLQYDALRAIVNRRSKIANVKRPAIHGFRRTFAITMLRSGKVDIFTLAKLMGHSSILVLQRYLQIISDDARDAHDRAKPVDDRL
jgi:integrase/recombinase XerD